MFTTTGTAVQLVLAPELFDDVRLRRDAVVSELSVRLTAFVVVLVEVIDVVPNPVNAIFPDVPVRLSAPVVWVKPFDAVNVDAKVPVDPTLIAPPKPAPPVTTSAPVEELVDAVLFVVASVPNVVRFP